MWDLCTLLSITQQCNAFMCDIKSNMMMMCKHAVAIGTMITNMITITFTQYQYLYNFFQKRKVFS